MALVRTGRTVRISRKEGRFRGEQAQVDRNVQGDRTELNSLGYERAASWSRKQGANGQWAKNGPGGDVAVGNDVGADSTRDAGKRRWTLQTRWRWLIVYGYGCAAKPKGADAASLRRQGAFLALSRPL
jgi:hypothetical protein